MTVIPRGLHIFIESGHRGRTLDPFACLRSGATIIEVVINGSGRMLLIELRFIQHHQAARPRVHDVVLENIVCHVPLHLELAGPGCRRVIFIESVVDHRAVVSVPALRRIASERNARGMGVINKIVPRRDVTRGTVLVLAGQFDSEVHIVDDVLFDQYPVPPST